MLKGSLVAVDNTDILETNEVIIQTALDHEKWFEDNIHHYKSLAAMVSATLKSTLDGHGISYVDIPFREKSKKSFLKKIEDKNKEKTYSPKDMTDLAGIRVITLIESDIKKVSELIHILFKVHPEDSINKTESLGEDKVGYRSVHFVCDIGETRAELPEWEFLKGHSFEIQVRTALMHAWAEIEHDRGYKLSGKLPSDLARRFSLLSGLLESADLEFNRLTIEIEEYAKKLNTKIQENEELNIELTTIGIKTLIKKKYIELCPNLDTLGLGITNEQVLKELQQFGVKNLNDLDKLIIENLNSLKKIKNQTLTGFVRNIMMFSNLDKYFEVNTINNIPPFRVMDNQLYDILVEIYGSKLASDILEKYTVMHVNIDYAQTLIA